MTEHNDKVEAPLDNDDDQKSARDDNKTGEENYWLRRKNDLNGEGVPYSEWDDSRMLVPSSLELGPGAVDRYVISKQIVRMQEPRKLT